LQFNSPHAVIALADSRQDSTLKAYHRTGAERVSSVVMIDEGLQGLVTP
jgi:hypothetical protein